MDFFCSQYQMPEGECPDADPRKATSEDIRRETFNNPQQISICGSNTSEKETFNADVQQRLEQLEKKCRQMDSENRSRQNDHEARLQLLEKQCSALLGRYPDTQKEAEEKEEYEKLKEKIRKLETRNQNLLSQAMSMHKQSENMNDPLRLSAVLDMFKKLKLQDWGKCWSSSVRWSYQSASSIIQKLFGACERDTEMRKTRILEILGYPPPYYAANSCKQEQMLDILKLLRYSYYHNDSGICEIIKDSPVKAVWNLYECSLQHVEHVDQQDIKYCKKTELRILWPLLKDAESVIESAVVWNEK